MATSKKHFIGVMLLSHIQKMTLLQRQLFSVLLLHSELKWCYIEKKAKMSENFSLVMSSLMYDMEN
ncbi:CLUMA_CG021649, isoform A [Clunio marinus]|uniref:CLUMA_CG021649, isoform A n=1 Tax=Clunio marinus TaxID=568069 RepID=A0A1J1J7Q2_9DIPT|nr:CLUMA_CG021649, isoform A [Clunio marinus]